METSYLKLLKNENTVINRASVYIRFSIWEENKMVNDTNTQNIDAKKRDFLKKAVYVAPALITMTAVPSFASAGSGWTRGNEGVGNGYDPAPPGHHGINYNDFVGTRPGRPGHKHPRR